MALLKRVTFITRPVTSAIKTWRTRPLRLSVVQLRMSPIATTRAWNRQPSSRKGSRSWTDTPGVSSVTELQAFVAASASASSSTSGESSGNRVSSHVGVVLVKAVSALLFLSFFAPEASREAGSRSRHLVSLRFGVMWLTYRRQIGK